jgi:hypothetical protein
MTIAWTEFDWPSFSTLAAGGAAVIGATLVGRMQIRIAARQTEILERQTAAAEVTLRHELFDRRYSVYRATADFVAETLSVRMTMGSEGEVEFLDAREQSKFLFRPEVHEQLSGIFQRCCAYDEAKEELAHAKASEMSEDQETRAKRQELRKRLQTDFIRLTDLFGDEMRLGELTKPRHKRITKPIG